MCVCVCVCTSAGREAGLPAIVNSLMASGVLVRLSVAQQRKRFRANMQSMSDDAPAAGDDLMVDNAEQAHAILPRARKAAPLSELQGAAAIKRDRSEVSNRYLAAFQPRTALFDTLSRGKYLETMLSNELDVLAFVRSGQDVPPLLNVLAADMGSVRMSLARGEQAMCNAVESTTNERIRSMAVRRMEAQEKLVQQHLSALRELTAEHTLRAVAGTPDAAAAASHVNETVPSAVGDKRPRAIPQAGKAAGGEDMVELEGGEFSAKLKRARLDEAGQRPADKNEGVTSSSGPQVHERGQRAGPRRVDDDSAYSSSDANSSLSSDEDAAGDGRTPRTQATHRSPFKPSAVAHKAQGAHGAVRAHVRRQENGSTMRREVDGDDETDLSDEDDSVTEGGPRMAPGGVGGTGADRERDYWMECSLQTRRQLVADQAAALDAEDEREAAAAEEAAAAYAARGLSSTARTDVTTQDWRTSYMNILRTRQHIVTPIDDASHATARALDASIAL
ncbi:hypothetical protein EON66_03025, partial [archaeon]